MKPARRGEVSERRVTSSPGQEAAFDKLNFCDPRGPDGGGLGTSPALFSTGGRARKARRSRRIEFLSSRDSLNDFNGEAYFSMDLLPKKLVSTPVAIIHMS